VTIGADEHAAVGLDPVKSRELGSRVLKRRLCSSDDVRIEPDRNVALDQVHGRQPVVTFWTGEENELPIEQVERRNLPLTIPKPQMRSTISRSCNWLKASGVWIEFVSGVRALVIENKRPVVVVKAKVLWQRG
jgi:hypothetical protein